MRASAFRTPSRRALAVAALVVLLVAVPLVLLAGAPADDAPEQLAAAPVAAGAGAGGEAAPTAPPARRAAAPADLPPLLFASDREPEEGTSADGEGASADGEGASGATGDARPGYRLYAAEPDGTGVVAVSDALAMFPAWSQDGTQIAYVGEAAGFTARRAALAVVEADGAVRDLVAGPQVPSHPAFRDRDGELWFQSSLQGSNGAAGVSERATIDAADLADGRPRTMLDRRGAIYQPAWSPDGSRLAVVLGDPGCRAGQRCRQTLAVSDGAGTAREQRAASGEERAASGDDAGLKLRTLVADGAPATPAWSPDGKRIAFTSTRRGTPQIHVVTVADGSVRQVTTGAQGAAEPTWAPDGETLAFSRACDIFVQRIGEAAATNVTRTRACEISPAWRPETAR